MFPSNKCSLVFSLFGISWVMPGTVVQLLACWQGRIRSHQGVKAQKATPLSVLKTIWRERNIRTFDGVERPHIIKPSFLRSFFDWMEQAAALLDPLWIYRFFESQCVIISPSWYTVCVFQQSFDQIHCFYLFIYFLLVNKSFIAEKE